MKKLFTIAAVLCGIILCAESTEVINGFQPAVAPGKAPKTWNFVSGSAKGGVEVLTVDSGVAVMLRSEKKNNAGVYSKAIPATAGDKIKISAKVYGSGKMIFSIFQYGVSGGTTTQKKVVATSEKGSDAVVEFVVADTKKSKTGKIRVAFITERGNSAAVHAPKAWLEKAPVAGK